MALNEGATTMNDSVPPAPRRFPKAVYGHGTEPDPRFSLANERTFLAWIRTSLALIAAGVALEALQMPIERELRFVSAIVFVVLGLLAAVQAWLGWVRTERALRENRALSGPTLAAVITAGIVIGTGVMTWALFR
jgi:putative membrane protein